MASGVPVCWLIIAGHLEETFHRQNTAGSHPLLLFICSYYLLYNVNTNFPQSSAVCHFKILPDGKD
jgi:hypothetical protein